MLAERLTRQKHGICYYVGLFQGLFQAFYITIMSCKSPDTGIVHGMVLRDATENNIITSQHNNIYTYVPWQTSKYLRGIESESVMDTQEARASRMVDGAPEAFEAR